MENFLAYAEAINQIMDTDTTMGTIVAVIVIIVLAFCVYAIYTAISSVRLLVEAVACFVSSGRIYIDENPNKAAVSMEKFKLKRREVEIVDGKDKEDEELPEQ